MYELEHIVVEVVDVDMERRPSMDILVGTFAVFLMLDLVQSLIWKPF